MKKGDTRGLSTVVATLLVILLVIVAVVIVWQVIRTIITQGAEDISLGKFTIDLEIVSIKQNPADVNIKVKRNPGEGELEGIIFSIFDGQETHLYEKHNVTLNPLDMKTFVVDYTGNIVSISIFPVLKSSSGKPTTGTLSDVFYVNPSGGGYVPADCVPNCVGKTACEDNGCEDNCGLECSGNTPYCIDGQCKADTGGLERDCTCATDTCAGTTCPDGIGGTCPGTKQPDCTDVICGRSLNECGSCSECETGYHCAEGGGCVRDCAQNCGTRECGPDPNGCGSCGAGCNSANEEWCNDGTCVTTPCEQNCLGRECGLDPVCNEPCGLGCDATLGEYCSPTTHTCILEEAINTGVVYSVWPIGAGIYFDSPDLPKSIGVSYTGYYAKFPGSDEFDCLPIDNFQIPLIPNIYNMSYIKFGTSASSIQANDNYEIWRTYPACIL